MTFFETLLRTYDKADELGLVDQSTNGELPLLPIFHTNKKNSQGTDVLVVTLTKNGQIISSQFLPQHDYIIFPVTDKSVTRGAEPHPLNDQFKFLLLSDDNPLKIEKQQNLTKWIETTTDSDVKNYLTIIKTFLEQPDFDTQIYNNLYPNGYTQNGFKITPNDANKTIDFSGVHLEIIIDNFKDYKNISITNYKDLHQSYIQFVHETLKTEQKTNPERFRTCAISGKKDKIISKHRGIRSPLSNTKLFAVSKNGREPYAGRLTNGKTDPFEKLIPIGYESSEKIHLMLKYLLNHPNSSKYITSGKEYILVWQSLETAPKNNNIQDELFTLLGLGNYHIDDDDIITPTDENSNILKQLTSGYTNDTETLYHIAIIYQTSSGHSALKYFDTFNTSTLKSRLNQWANTYKWYNEKNNPYPMSFTRLINHAYGYEIDKKIQLKNEALKTNAYQELLTALLNGHPIPQSIQKQLTNAIHFRNRYSDDEWNRLMKTTLAVSNKQTGKDYTPMLDRTETNRSYLFGRLLAVYEQIERKKYYFVNNIKDKEKQRMTNAERLWSAYLTQPAKTLMSLEQQLKSYEKALERQKLPDNKGNIIHTLKKEKDEINQLLENYRNTPEINKPLDIDFIFGYNAETNHLTQKKS